MLTVTDILELIQYHLVASAPDDERAENNLEQLVVEIALIWPRPLRCEMSWMLCDGCGCSVDPDLVRPDGHYYSDDGDFYCADCQGQNVLLRITRSSIVPLAHLTRCVRTALLARPARP